jgi:RNA polymerase sigma-70 factor (ECF subfamily)
MDTETIQKEFLQAYEENSDALFRQCFFKVHDRELARDILQETFTRTWDYLAKGKEIQNMRAFLFRTMNNMVVDHYRRKKSVSLDALSEEGFDPEALEGINANDRMEGAKALKLLDNIPSQYKIAQNICG